ncbi:MAG: alpha-ketoglutarate-dependent dioxygenase AlkB, partial [Flavobacteriales bacterium]|nr:alpha-ketoglutarate-dependent dioxygenase AlkB [Flavobacteriales bacterium]
MYHAVREKSILTTDGRVNYVCPLFGESESKRYFKALESDIAWKNDVVIMFGKRLEMRRNTAWYGDKPFDYTYSKISRKALPWTPALLEIKNAAEKLSGDVYNSCLLNYYSDGDDGMGWHSDDEPELDPENSIASISFGVERKFTLKHKLSGEKCDVVLENGSALIMHPPTQ